MMRYLYGDMFIVSGYIFRIYNHPNPKKFVIAYPIYKVGQRNELTKDFDRKKILKQYLVPIGPGVNFPLIKKKEIKSYIQCLNIPLKDTSIFFNYFLQIKRRLEKIGITHIGLTGSGRLRLNGFIIKNKNSDIDIIIVGKRNSVILKNRIDEIFDDKFVSYKEFPERIYFRRKLKSTPHFIDMKTAKEFESQKTIGILNNKIHVNITPTLNISGYLKKPKIKNLGLVETTVRIKSTKYSNTVPGYYEIECYYNGKKIEKLYSNFFYYLLGAENGDKFNVCGELIEKDKGRDKEYFLSLDSSGLYKKYFMNKVS